MSLLDELKSALKPFPLSKRVNDLPETAFVQEVANAFGIAPQVNASDFSMLVIGLIKNGKTPNDGAGAIPAHPEAQDLTGEGA